MIKLAVPQNTLFQSKALTWYGQVQGMVDVSNSDAYSHAEDGVFFLWGPQVPTNRITQGQDAGGLMVGVYGQKNWYDKNNNVQTDGPRIWDLCGAGADARNPTCQAVAGSLNVNWARRPRRRRDINMDAEENQANYDGPPATAADVAAAEDVDIACGASIATSNVTSATTSNAKLRLRPREHGAAQRKSGARGGDCFQIERLFHHPNVKYGSADLINIPFLLAHVH